MQLYFKILSSMVGTIIIVVLVYFVGAASDCDEMPDYFQAATTEDYYAVVVDSFNTDCNINICDEIGIFDQDYCVGSAVFLGDLPMTIQAWKDDELTEVVDGYTPGNSILFKVWKTASNDTSDEWLVHYTQGDGIFDNGAYARLWLECIGNDLQYQQDQSVYLPELIEQNTPNPFNSETVISFNLPRRNAVAIAIYNTLGQKVKTLVFGEYDSGRHQVKWDGKDNYGIEVSSGVYFYKIIVGDSSSTKKMLLLK